MLVKMKKLAACFLALCLSASTALAAIEKESDAGGLSSLRTRAFGDDAAFENGSLAEFAGGIIPG